MLYGVTIVWKYGRNVKSGGRLDAVNRVSSPLTVVSLLRTCRSVHHTQSDFSIYYYSFPVVRTTKLQPSEGPRDGNVYPVIDTI